MKTPDLKKFIYDIEPEDSVIAHSPSEFLAQLARQEPAPDSPISEFNLEDTVNQPTFMKTPSIARLLKVRPVLKIDSHNRTLHYPRSLLQLL
jgi:hypothetical protein